ncbi:heme A synthase [Halalkalibacillus sediminis]|uniref:Heme A synthase n=1 Tax=Halalkalibacillus sediminis TaxID=2018042 RepID=A0A2I0QW21_9BACI|nr:heme A synthase [Halalkalibacillus sediminis]PKR78499.1 heme A synthase [Halalkalibacillus sediminis]
MNNSLNHKVIATLSLISMLFVLIGGALVTKTESGLGCGRSWPLCNGELIPSTITAELVIEFSHRVMSGFAIILILILSYIAWKYYRHIEETKFLIFMSLLFIVIQSLLGAAAVLVEQTSVIKALHFGISLVSFAAVFLLTLIIFNVDEKFHTKQASIPVKIKNQFYSLLVYTLVVVYTGALVRHKQASLVCRDWPFCFNDQALAIGSYSLQQWIQMGHRLLAGLLLVWVVLLLIHILKNYRSNRFLVVSWSIAASLIVLQVLLGALVIITLMNVVFALMHALIISLFFALLCYLVMIARRTKKD